MELWDVYDKNRVKTGKTMLREDYFKSNPDDRDYHLAVHIWIKNSRGEWLISKRTPNKSFPLMWEHTGGSVLAGEDSLDGALREVKEELGVNLDKSKGYLYTSMRRDIFPDFCDVWVFECDCDISEITLQEDETCDAMWASSEKIKALINEGLFVPLDNMQYVNTILNPTVNVTVDRPLGSRHPRHQDMQYPVNYGYVSGIIAADGEVQDAYVVGVDYPVNAFEGRLIAIINRKNDIECKWVVAPQGKCFTVNEIMEQVHFQEKYFDIEITLL